MSRQNYRKQRALLSLLGILLIFLCRAVEYHYFRQFSLAKTLKYLTGEAILLLLMVTLVSVVVFCVLWITIVIKKRGGR